MLASTRKMLRVVSPIKIVDHERRQGFRVSVDLHARISVSREKLEYDDIAGIARRTGKTLSEIKKEIEGFKE